MIQEARSETLDNLYKKVKTIWTKDIDADHFHISISAADTIFTYYQDKMGLTHYLFFVGGNDSGKSNNLFVLKYLAYRNFTSTGMTVANIYQFLGNGEEGQGLFCYDEAEKLDEDRLMMANSHLRVTHSGLGKYASVNTDEREPVAIRLCYCR